MNQRPIARRTFIRDLGRGVTALAVLGAATRPGLVRAQSPAPAASAGTSPAPGGSPLVSPGALAWERVNLGFVSAYILVRAGEAAIVDTGVAGSADAIEASLAGIGLDWASVGHLVLTHHHADHIGSAVDIMERAPDATAYAGAEDAPSIAIPRPPTVVADGDEVFGMQVITVPGHTPGSIAVLDPTASLLVAGDALVTMGGPVALPGAQFTDDMEQAKQSVVKLGTYTFQTLLVGHGNPIEGGASAQVAALGGTF